MTLADIKEYMDMRDILRKKSDEELVNRRIILKDRILNAELEKDMIEMEMNDRRRNTSLTKGE